MGLTMNELLKKFNECNKFSLSDKCTQCRITEEEFENALKESEEHIKRERRKYYKKEDFLNYDICRFARIYGDLAFLKLSL